MSLWERRAFDLVKNFCGILIVLSGPSGIGKGTVISELIKRREKLKVSVSVTTREPRQGEKDGIDYFFTGREKFLEMVQNSEFLEYAEYCNNFYGTPQKNVLNMLNEENDVILEIDVKGAEQIKEKFSDAVSIFIAPKSEDMLKERLLNRGLDSESVIKERVKQSEREIKSAINYDYLVVNDQLEKCVEDIIKIVEVEHMKVKRSSYIEKEG